MSEVKVVTDPSVAPVVEPKLFAGKYNTVAELEAGYAAAQATISGKPPVTPPAAAVVPPVVVAPAVAEGEQVAVEAGFDWEKLNMEFHENDGLTDATYAELEAKGFPKNVVDTYISGARGDAKAYDNAVYDAAGGEANYTAINAWAKVALSAPEKEAFNAAVSSGNVASATLATQGLASKYAAANKAAVLIHGKPATPAGVTPFASQAEVTKAMGSPSYRNDPAYRQQVADRLAVSNVFSG